MLLSKVANLNSYPNRKWLLLLYWLERIFFWSTLKIIVCLPKMWFCCRFHKMLTANMKLFLRVWRCTLSVPTLRLLIYRKGTREMTYDVPKAVKTWAVVCECFSSALLEKEHFSFFEVFAVTSGNNRGKENGFVLGNINKGFPGTTLLLYHCFL